MSGTSKKNAVLDDSMERISAYISQQRQHAPFFGWFRNPEGKQIQEKGVVGDLCESILAEEGSLNWSQLQPGPAPNLAPDCLAKDKNDQWVGFEVTELVDETSIANAERGMACDFKEWSEEELVRKIQEIIRKKCDSSSWKEHQRSTNVLVMHTDEPWLRISHQEHSSILKAHVFIAAPFLHEAYLLYSYIPGLDHYPYVRLNLRAT